MSLSSRANVHEIIDSDDTRVEADGKPAFLRFDHAKDYETATTDPWYRTIVLDRNGLEVTTGKHLIYKNARYVQYRVEVTYRHEGDLPKQSQFTFRTLLPDSDLPTVKDWYYGDTH